MRNRKRRSATKTQRLEARVTADQKRRLEYAARLRGTSLTDFVVLSAIQEARRTITEHDSFRLGARGRELFFSALVRPPAPPPRLVAAARRYRRRVAGR
ncbi:MAG: DUF1778 domain-containing protein [Terriglobales bacterium]